MGDVSDREVTRPRDRDTARADIAHLLRRATMSAHPERIEEWAALSREDAVERLLAPDEPVEVRSSATDWNDMVRWWIERMTEPHTGLTDRMAWFWHGLLTTNAYKVGDGSLLSDQLQILRDHARGNFRTLLHHVVTSGSLLEYLDASYSIASEPNENLARELMEVYTLGRGHFTEDDVRAAARGLAGWVVEGGAVEFRPEGALDTQVVFLGERKRWGTATIVDRLCDHPATARRIARRLWQVLRGTTLDDPSATDLGRWWQEHDLEIDPLVAHILRKPNFFDLRLNRPRSGLEWFCAVRVATGVEPVDWWLEYLGQKPYLPPTVAGWADDRWLTPGSLLSRLSVVNGLDLVALRPEAAPDHPGSFGVDDLLDQCGLWTVSEATTSAIADVTVSDELDAAAAARVRWRIALSSGEFQLC